MKSSALQAWARLHDLRVAQARRSPPDWVVLGAIAGIVGVVAFCEGLAGRGNQRIGWWLMGLVVAVLWNIFAAPHRLYWRRDSLLWVRLPIPGRTVFMAALRHCIRASFLAALPFLVGILALAAHLELPVVLAGIVVWMVCILVGGVLAPSVSLLAGVLSSSKRAQAAIRNLVQKSSGMRVREVPVSWLGGLQGLTGTAMVVSALVFHSWLVADARVAGWVAAGFLVGASVVLFAACTVLSEHSIKGALRDTAALDKDRLAHVDLSTPSLLESLWLRLLSAEPRLVIEKDIRLARRRFPLPYALCGLAVVVCWICALVGGDSAHSVGLVAGLALQGTIIMQARRLMEEPVEIARLSFILPMGQDTFIAAKRLHTAFRALGLSAVAGGALCARYSDLATVASVALFGLLGTILAILQVQRPRQV